MDPNKYPRCKRCKLRLIMGMMHASILDNLIKDHGWKIGRYGRKSYPTAEWDAVLLACAAHKCPRCSEPITD
jgi:hypothetical protein